MELILPSGKPFCLVEVNDLGHVVVAVKPFLRALGMESGDVRTGVRWQNAPGAGRILMWYGSRSLEPATERAGEPWAALDAVCEALELIKSEDGETVRISLDLEERRHAA